MNPRRFIVVSLTFLLFISCEKKEPFRLGGNVFGTTYSIIYYGNANYESAIDGLFTDVNKSLSTYIPTSDISKINNGEKDVKVDALFKEVFQKSERIFQETDGYFDPTVGDLVNAWGFGPEKPLNDLDSTKVSELMSFVGFDKVKIKDGLVVKRYDETYFDFNSIAKGYGIDVIGRFLESKGVKNYLVEIGGEIRARGTKPEGKLWTVQLDNPNTDGSRSAYTLLQLTDKSMASSGNYRKFRITEDGQKYVHTINPKTGYATESNLLAATVIADLDCADVDAYATAFMAMGLERSKVFLSSKPNLEAILIYVDENGELKEFTNRK
ncbi:FAD:protein FMN transferase [Flavobacteriaceae bacterium S356]|uniref:FAD:protein FMN transferase n=1 Tax=Asprobacillus argus TaxID=3076534 RepID=A0ABU3LC32_9FLAO|nr:FAD:protein FMN transferase [Flavobacteriaceae bacterium S356]